MGFINIFIYVLKDSVDKVDFFLSIKISNVSNFVGNYFMSEMDFYLLDF